ncbi:MAG: GNAT family N-acetyltransferase, partial [Burkholderiales bacterium]
ADAWQRSGVGEALMRKLAVAARAGGVARLEGAVLRSNASMLRFVARLGFAVRDNPEDPEQVIVSRELARAF